MSDPFEESSVYHATNSPTLREASVQQAISFLNDPRVKSADQSRAISFLRQKGITDDELREAYRRCGIPFPSNISNQLPQQATVPAVQIPTSSMTYNPTTVPPFTQNNHQLYQPQRQRTSWFSLFLGITAAAGLYAAVREVLKRYVVPLYFPDAARIAEERRRREEHNFHAQETQIAELRDRIQELLTSSERTNDRVENLSKSISSSIALRQQELSEASELRDAIRQLSHSVTASGGTDISRHRKEISPATGDNSIHTKLFHGSGQAHKLGSLSYSHVNHFSTVQTDKISKEPGPVADGIKKSQKGLNEQVTTGQTHVDETDDFMTIAPAEVDDSWLVRPGTSENQQEQSHFLKEKEERVSTNRPNHLMEELRASGSATNNEFIQISRGVTRSPDQSDVYSDVSRRLFHNLNKQNAKVQTSVTSNTQASTEQATNQTGYEEIEVDLNKVTDMSKVENNDMRHSESKKDEDNKEQIEPNGKIIFDSSITAVGGDDDRIEKLDENEVEEAKAELELDMMEEARKLFGINGTNDRLKKGKSRPLSMPAMDAPLSDTEY